MRKPLATLAAAAILGLAGGANAANVCYDAIALDSNRSVGLVRLRTRAAGTLVPQSEGAFSGPARTLFDVDGRLSRRTGLVINGRPQVEMSLVTGTALVVAGKGAQMTLQVNLGRILGSPPGFSVLDCGSTTASDAPPSWTCRGTAALASSGTAVTAARALRLTRVDPTGQPQCRDYAILAN